MNATPDTASTLLYVDDEELACKWFARTFSDHCTVLTANSVEQAQMLLQEAPNRIDVVLTDFRMPNGDGTELLRIIEAQYNDIPTILITAYADKALLLKAINTGRVLRILEKPYPPEDMRRALQEALALRQNRLLHTQRFMAIDETLAFLAHELNTPLATIANFADGIHAWGDQSAPTPETLPHISWAAEHIRSNARYCLSVLSTFLNSVRDTYSKPSTTAVASRSARGLIHALFDAYPFTSAQRAWTSHRIEQDFLIPAQPNCVMLVLASLIRNALVALSETRAPRLDIIASANVEATGARHTIRIEDNGPGIAPEILARLTIDPVTTHASEIGHGMGMIFCERIMQSFGGAITIDSTLGAGTRVTLTFP